MPGFIGAVCIRQENAPRGPLSLWPIVSVGTISDGVYLPPVLALNASRRGARRVRGGLHFVTVTVFAVAVASVSHRCFERPFLKLKERFGPRAPVPPTSPA